MVMTLPTRYETTDVMKKKKESRVESNSIPVIASSGAGNEQHFVDVFENT